MDGTVVHAHTCSMAGRSCGAWDVFSFQECCAYVCSPGSNQEGGTSPQGQTTSVCPLKSASTIICSQVETLVRMRGMQMLPEMGPHSWCRNSLVLHTGCCIICPAGCSQTILEVGREPVEVPCCLWLRLISGGEAVWMYRQIL